MHKLKKKFRKVFRNKFVGTGPSSYKKKEFTGPQSYKSLESLLLHEYHLISRYTPT